MRKRQICCSGSRPYQASAQAFAIGNATFTTFMNSINGTFT